MQNYFNSISEDQNEAIVQAGGNFISDIASLAIPFAFLIGVRASQKNEKPKETKKKSQKGSGLGSNFSSGSLTPMDIVGNAYNMSQNFKGLNSNNNNTRNNAQKGSGFASNLLTPTKLTDDAYNTAKSMNTPNTKL